MTVNVYLDTPDGRLLVGPFRYRGTYSSIAAVTTALLARYPNLTPAVGDGRVWLARKGRKMEYAPSRAETGGRPGAAVVSGRLYADRDAATRAWLRRARAAGLVDVLGGGWRRVRGIGRGRRPIQGRTELGRYLERCGQLQPATLPGPDAPIVGWRLAAQLPAPPAPARGFVARGLLKGPAEPGRRCVNCRRPMRGDGTAGECPRCVRADA